MSHPYLLPPLLTDSRGAPRRAGFEFEFGNLPVAQTAEALRQSLGGSLETKTPFEAVLHDSALGKLTIERDANVLKSVRYRKWLKDFGFDFDPGTLGHSLESNVDNASRLLIPCEVVTEPIPFAQLSKLDTLTHTLELLGAQGTQDSLVYAFGLHINASIPDAEADTLRRYLQAFLLLETWIIESSEIDVTRRFFTKYIDPFPRHYVQLVLAQNYAPDIDQFVADYLEHNPTRNRALDLLPILCELDRERVLAAVRHEERSLVRGRPAFHYRLPDCKMNEPGWGVVQPWNEWVFIEKLANDESLLVELVAQWRLCNEAFSFAPKANWAMRLTSILSRKFFEG